MIIKNKLKKIIIILSSILLLFLIIITIKNIYEDYKKAKELEELKQIVLQYNSIKQFNNIQEVALYLNCELIEVEEVEKQDYKYNIYLKIEKSLTEKDVEPYYEKLIQYSAYSLKYENFYLIDKEKNINILVICNKEKELVVTYYINGVQNYFLNKKSQDNMLNYKNIETIKVNIQSEILNDLLKNSWTEPKNLGTVDSYFNNYNIYFEEGFEIKKINNKVFNIIFKNNYKDKIVNNITIETNQNEIINQLGQPQFQVSNIIGYKTENMYIFFTEKEISIYPIIEFNSNDFVKNIEQFVQEKDIQKTIIEIKNIWKDYDIYEYSNNSIVLQYTTKGIKFVYGTENNNGIYLYNNYTGKINENDDLNSIIKNKQELPENIYFSNSDLVCVQEIQRIQNKYDVSNNIPSEIVLNTSTKFKVVLEQSGNEYSVKFISIDGLNANCELNVDITKGIWADDYNFIYYIQNQGIYIYNLKNRSSKLLKQKTNEEEKFDIKNIDENNLYYDDTYIKIEI